MLTIDSFWSTVINLGLNSLIAWSLSRLWRVACAVIFRAVYNERPSWEESQNTALIVNNKAALDGFFNASGLLVSRRASPGGWKTGKSRTALIVIAFTALIIFGLAVSFPFYVAFIPVSNQGLVVSNDCGIRPAGEGTIDSWASLWGVKVAQSANAAFGVLDGVDMVISLAPADLQSDPRIIPPKLAQPIVKNA